MTIAPPFSASLMIIELSFLIFSKAVRSSFDIFDFVGFSTVFEFAEVRRHVIYSPRCISLLIGGLKPFWFLTSEISSSCSLPKNSFRRNFLQNSSVSLMISTLSCFGVGVNFKPYSRSLISLSLKVRFNRLIIFGSVSSFSSACRCTAVLLSFSCAAGLLLKNSAYYLCFDILHSSSVGFFEIYHDG